MSVCVCVCLCHISKVICSHSISIKYIRCEMPVSLTDWMAKAHHITQRCQNVYTNTRIYYITYSINTKLFKLSPLSSLSHACAWVCLLAQGANSLTHSHSLYLFLTLYSFTVVLSVFTVLLLYCYACICLYFCLFVCCSCNFECEFFFCENSFP